MIITDLDGTLFNNHHRAHLIPSDKDESINWSEFNKACANDSPIIDTINFVKYMSESTAQPIVFVTSRGEDSRKETSKQLANHFTGLSCKLHMRPMNDVRCSVGFKEDVFRELINNSGLPVLVVDDQPEIIQMVGECFPGVSHLLVQSFDCTVTSKRGNHVTPT